MRYLVTGGAGFIGSNFIRFLFKKYGDDAQVVNLDKLTYAGIRENLAEYEGKTNYRFVQGDIAKADGCGRGVQGRRRQRRRRRRQLRRGDPRRPLAHGSAAPSSRPTSTACSSCSKKRASTRRSCKRFVQISTDEVYGSIAEGSFTRDRSAQSAQSVLGVEGRRRPHGLRVRADVRAAGDRHARVEQLRRRASIPRS